MPAHFVEGLDDGSTTCQVEGEHDDDGAVEPQEEALFVSKEAVEFLTKPV